MSSAESAPLVGKMSSSATKSKSAGMLTNEDVLHTEVSWASFQTAGIITREQLEMIYTIDQQSVPAQVALFHLNGLSFVSLFVDILTGINKDDVICYALAMLDEITQVDSNIACYWAQLLVATNGVLDPMAPLLKLLGRSSMFIVEKAATVLAKCLGAPIRLGTAPASGDVKATLAKHLVTFATWTVGEIKQVSPAQAADSSKVAAAMGGLQSLCSSMTGRTAAIEADALITLSTLITASTMSNSSSTVQLLYQTLFSLWSLSYSPEAAMEMSSSKLGLIAKLVEIVKTSPKEKVIRVSLSILRNLLGVGSAPNDMVIFGLMPVLEAMQLRKFADEDIPDDIDLLYNTLQVNLQTLSSWDVYKGELDSLKLEWSPCHKSESFWKDNHKHFEDNNCEAIKTLVGLLSSDDAQVLAIACNDISELIKFHLEGRRFVTQYGGKPLAMQVLKHPDPTVQKYALTCVQRLMVINWEYLNSS